MKALRFHKFGSPSVLAIEETFKPAPGSGKVLVQVKAAAINPSDVKNVSGHFSGTTLPRTPGRDFAGIVIEGARVPGEEVWGSGPTLGITQDGAHAAYVVVPAEIICRKPRNLTMEQAAAIGVPFITAWEALVRTAKLRPGETILIIGAAGAVGQAATQIANWRKARVLGAALHSEPIPQTEATINTAQENLRERVLELTKGKGADVLLDTVGGAMFEPALQSLRRGGRQIAITSAKDQRVSFNLVDFYHNRSRLFGVDSTALTPVEVGEIADALTPGFESSALRVPVIECVPFANAVETYQKVAAGHTGAKQVLTF